MDYKPSEGRSKASNNEASMSKAGLQCYGAFITNSFENVQPYKEGLSADCPIKHPKHNASLYITVWKIKETEYLDVKCSAGCTREAIIEAHPLADCIMSILPIGPPDD